MHTCIVVLGHTDFDDVRQIIVKLGSMCLLCQQAMKHQKSSETALTVIALALPLSLPEN